MRHTFLYNILPKGAFKTGTTDRGKEFACCIGIQEQLGLTLYFTDPYSSWQRGSNENSNGLLREFYPKKTDLAKVKQSHLAHSLFLINNRPRKCLGWKSPIQVFSTRTGTLDLTIHHLKSKTVLGQVFYVVFSLLLGVALADAAIVQKQHRRVSKGSLSSGASNTC